MQVMTVVFVAIVKFLPSSQQKLGSSIFDLASIPKIIKFQR
jgi:hypothetical protein